MNQDDTKYTSKEGELKEMDCYTDRKTVSTLNNKEGVIVLLDNVNFGIRYKGDTRQLLPCNLPFSLQKAGKRISFSGVVKETKLEELWAGEPFVLTRAEEM